MFLRILEETTTAAPTKEETIIFILSEPTGTLAELITANPVETREKVDSYLSEVFFIDDTEQDL